MIHDPFGSMEVAESDARPELAAELHFGHRDEVFSAERAVALARDLTALRRYWSPRRLRRESAP